MESFDLLRDCALPTQPDDVDCTPSTLNNLNDSSPAMEGDSSKGNMFVNIDWKISSIGDNDKNIQQEPFPNIKISIVKEIVSTGGSVKVDEIPTSTGKHLSPKEFHDAIVNNNGCANKKEVVLIDVRNTFEHDIGHFVLPQSGEKAMNPEMVTFSSFDSNFCAKQADRLKDKKVLMYCTGGIRCEKASVMLKRRGVEDVNQLSGGIHRYLEEYGNDGYYKGLNFVFDQRVAMKPSPSEPQNEIVGKCIECNTAYDEICGSRLCTVCRDLVLVCPTCRAELHEYHCRRHSEWKDCYYTFLDRFDAKELECQKTRLTQIHKSIPPGKQKNIRRTMSRQIEKISKHILRLNSGEMMVNKNAPRRCRTCMEPNSMCDGRCWGFWKTKRDATTPMLPAAVEDPDTPETTKTRLPGDGDATTKKRSRPHPPLLPVQVGDLVEPGEHWNTVRLGDKLDVKTGMLRRGKVVEVKCWAGGEEQDCVAVLWDDTKSPQGRNQDKIQPQIYRWGVVALDGTRMYDLQKGW